MPIKQSWTHSRSGSPQAHCAARVHCRACLSGELQRAGAGVFVYPVPGTCPFGVTIDSLKTRDTPKGPKGPYWKTTRKMCTGKAFCVHHKGEADGLCLHAEPCPGCKGKRRVRCHNPEVVAKMTAPETLSESPAGKRRLLLLETGKHHVSLFKQLAEFTAKGGWDVTRETWRPTEPLWGIPKLVAEMTAKGGAPPDAIMRWEEHGGLFVNREWVKACQWAYAHGIMLGMVDWGYFAHYKSVYFGYYREDGTPDVRDVWDELPTEPDWSKADKNVQSWHDAWLKEWARSEELGPVPGTVPGYVLVWVQYSANGSRIRHWSGVNWCENTAAVIREAGLVPVFKQPPTAGKMPVPEGEISFSHRSKIEHQNHRLVRFARHSVAITTTATAGEVLVGRPVVSCGEQWCNGLGVWHDTIKAEELAVTPKVNEEARGRWVNYWLRRQFDRAQAGEALERLVTEWKDRYVSGKSRKGDDSMDESTKAPRTFYGVGRGVGNLLMAVPAMKALANVSGGAIETASGKFAARSYRDWFGKQPFIRGGVPRSFPDMHGFDYVAGVAWDYYVPDEAPDGKLLAPGPKCRGPHETIADAAPFREIGGGDLLPSGRMVVSVERPKGLPVNYVVVAMDCVDKNGTMHPWNKRRWPHWEAFCKLWAARVPLVFVGVDKADWASKYGLDLIGTTKTIEEAAAIIEQADALVGIDGGLSHVAGAVRTPAIILYGPTTSYREGPWYGGLTPVSSGVRCRACFMDPDWQKCTRAKCMEQITPEQTVDVLERVLRRAGRPLEKELAYEQCQARIGYSARRGRKASQAHDPNRGPGEGVEDGRAIKPAQAREELMSLWPMFRELHAHTVVEIGSKRGGWMWTMAPTFAPHAQLVMVDMEPKPACTVAVDELRKEEYDASLIIGDSQIEETRDRLVEALGGKKIDILHIDGNHDTAFCLRDWELYSPLVRSGGLIVIHDAYNHREGVIKALEQIIGTGRDTGGAQYRVAEWRGMVAKRRKANQLGIAVALMA